MCCRIIEFREKQVISIKTGCIIGVVGDVEVETATGKVKSIVVFGRKRCFGLLGRGDDVIVPWECVEVIGRDSILVNYDYNVNSGKRRKKFFSEIWS